MGLLFQFVKKTETYKSKEETADEEQENGADNRFVEEDVTHVHLYLEQLKKDEEGAGS